MTHSADSNRPATVEPSGAGPAGASAARDERQWFIVGRWQEYAGEARTNLLRVLAIAIFYAIELVNYHGFEFGPLQIPAGVDREFHVVATWLAVAWTMTALATLLLLRLHVFPAALKYFTTGSDLVLLTTLLMVADGPRSPLVTGYFLIIAASATSVSTVAGVVCHRGLDGMLLVPGRLCALVCRRAASVDPAVSTVDLSGGVDAGRDRPGAGRAAGAAAGRGFRRARPVGRL